MAKHLGRDRVKGSGVDSDDEGMTEQEKREAELYEIPENLKVLVTPLAAPPFLAFVWFLAANSCIPVLTELAHISMKEKLACCNLK